jgi:hypothetical protein
MIEPQESTEMETWIPFRRPRRTPVREREPLVPINQGPVTVAAGSGASHLAMLDEDAMAFWRVPSR